MIVNSCGVEVNDLNDEKGEDCMENSKIQELMTEVEIYKQAIQDAKDALASAEMELDETLEIEFENQ